MMRKINEECGVYGIFAKDKCDVGSYVYYGLYALQHRGQESCGIVCNDDGLFTEIKGPGLVNEVFHDEEKLQALGPGTIAVGHVRYGTEDSAANSAANTQPLVVNHRKGRLALANNGSLVNAFELKEALEEKGAIFHSTSDAEVISYIIIQERLRCSSIEQALEQAMPQLEGAYSLIMMSPAKLIAARDPQGFHPLCYGMTKSGAYVFASESCALEASGAHFIRDVEPGEIVVVDKDGLRSITTHCKTKERSLCIFEYIYFARPDSSVDGESVHIARQRAGAFLALRHPVNADLVVGVPDSGLDAALGYARQSGIPYGIGFIKNKYIGRTFISPTQQMREDEVKIKLNPVSAAVKGKRIVLIDDSIVRGTTSKRIVNTLRQAGATEVHLRISSPPFLHACYYGTDIDSEDKLIASKHSVEEIAEMIGVDSLGFLSLEDVVKLPEGTHSGFCTACFDGNYPTRLPQKETSTYDKKISEDN